MLMQFSKIFRAVLLLIFAVSLSLPVAAQNPSSSVPKKSGSASSTCDGALDIVPTKAMSFARKRRPAKKDDANQTTAPANAKPSPKPQSN